MPLDFLWVGATPKEGYECLEHCGGSAFGSLWKVRIPDGSVRYWKVVDLLVGNAALETRNLELILGLKHPALNELIAYHSFQDEKALALETEIPTFTAKERLEECQKGGLGGIPGRELIEYMQDAAKGLDFLNAPQHEFQGSKVAIYHRDMRPENLWLFQEGEKYKCRIANFGLAKPVTEQSSNHSQGLQNYDYDPPEYYEGQTTSSSDQYSLAILYCHLRTGQLPFKGSMLEQLSARLNETPDLSDLPTQAERDAVKKALAKNPKQRYGSCLSMVAAFAEALNKKPDPEELAAQVPKAPVSDWGSATMRLPPMGRRPGGRIGIGSSSGATSAVLGGTEAEVVVESPQPGVTIRRPPQKFVPTPEELAAETDEDISNIVRGAPKSSNVPKSDLIRPKDLANVRGNSPADPDKIPIAWVILISLMVISAIAVIAREIVSMRGQ